MSRVRKIGVWLFVGALVSAAAIGLLLLRNAYAQRRAVAWVVSHGGEVSYAYQEGFYHYGPTDRDWSPYRPLPSAPPVLVKLFGIDLFEPVTEVFGIVGVDDVSPLVHFPELRRLHAEKSPISDLESLSRLGELEVIWLMDTDVIEVEPLARLERVRFLDITGANVEDVSAIGGMSQLRVLILNRTRVRDIAALSKLKNLHLLVLAETEVQDIAPLMTMKALRRVDLFGTLVAAEDIRRLQQALPECYITWDTPLFAKQPEHPR